MNELISKIIEKFRTEQCIPDNRVFSDDEIDKLVATFKDWVMKYEGIYPKKK